MLFSDKPAMFGLVNYKINSQNKLAKQFRFPRQLMLHRYIGKVGFNSTQIKFISLQNI